MYCIIIIIIIIITCAVGIQLILRRTALMNSFYGDLHYLCLLHCTRYVLIYRFYARQLNYDYDELKTITAVTKYDYNF